MNRIAYNIFHLAGGILRRVVCLSLALAISMQLFAQSDPGADSLRLVEARQAWQAGDWDQVLMLAEQILNLEGQSETLTVEAQYLVAKAWLEKGELSPALRNFLLTLNMREIQEASFSLSALHLDMAKLYEKWPVYEQAANSYLAAWDQAKFEHQVDLEPIVLRGIARNKEAGGKIKESLDFYQQLRQLYQERKEKNDELGALRNIIRIQKENGFSESALQSNLEALRLNESEADTAEIIISLNNIGVLYRQLEQYDQALTYFIRAAEMEDLYLPQSGSNPITLINIGILYENLGDYNNSLVYLSQAEKQSQSASQQDSSLLANISNLIAIIHLNTNALNKAYAYNQGAIDLAKAIHEPSLEQLFYKTRSNIHEQANNYDRALDYYRQHIRIKDSLFQHDQTEREKNLLRRFSAEQTEKEMNLLLVDKEIAELKLRQDQLENERLRQENSLTEQALKLAQQEIQKQEAEQALVLAQNQLLSEQKDRQITLLEKEQSEKELQLTAERLRREQQDREIAQVERETAESKLALQEKDFTIQSQQEKLFRNTVLGILLTSLIVLALLLRNMRLRRKANRVLSEQKHALEETLNTLKHTQTQLVHAEKMASLGALTAGVAHEINNPLNFVSSNAHALKLDLSEIKLLLDEVHKLKENRSPEQVDVILKQIDELDTEFLNEEVQELIASIERGALRTKNIVLGLRTFSRNADDEFVLADIHEGLDSTLTILNSKLKNRIEVHKDYGKIPRIYCQFDKLNQVFMNILSNAVQAIKEEGHIYIQTRGEAEQVILTIRDSGSGIPEEVRARIFEPFFTTKPLGEGTGLGLSISYGIVENHGGQIEVDSELGVGTTFRISLPVKKDVS